MIQVKHTLTFPTGFDLSSLEKDQKIKELLGVQSLCREEASNRGCIFFKDIEPNIPKIIMNFIWITKEEADTFVKWANDTHNYETVYAQFVERIKELGGTVTKEESVLE